MAADRIDRARAIALVRRFLNAMAAMDFDAVAAMLTVDAIVDMPFGPTPLHLVGRDAVRDTFGHDIPLFLKHVVFTIERETFDEAAQRVVLEYRSEGERSDGRSYANRYIGCWDFEDGAILEWREYYNPLKLA